MKKQRHLDSLNYIYEVEKLLFNAHEKRDNIDLALVIGYQDSAQGAVHVGHRYGEQIFDPVRRHTGEFGFQHIRTFGLKFTVSQRKIGFQPVDQASVIPV